MKFQAFHVNPGEKLKGKDVNNDLSNFMSVFPIVYQGKRRVRVGRVSNFVIFCQVLYCCTFCNCQYIYTK